MRTAGDALLEGPRHGYGIVREAETLSGGRVRLTAGTLDGALERLVADGLVSVDREEVVSGCRRRYRRLTEAGGGSRPRSTGRVRVTSSAIGQRIALTGTARPSEAGRQR